MKRAASDPIAALIGAVQLRRPELHDRLRAEVEAQVPDFRFTDDAAEARAQQLRDDVIDGVLGAVRTGDLGDVTFNQELGRAMAEAGLPLAHHFIAHRTAYPLLLAVLLQELDRQGRSDLAPVVARRHAAHASAVTEAYVGGYVEARAVAELDGERSVRTVLDGLLQSTEDWSPRLTSQAALVGVEPETPVVVVVMTWERLPDGLSPELVRRRLAGWLKLAPSRPLLVPGAGIEGIAVPGGRPGAVLDTLRRGVAQLVADGVDGFRCGLSTTGPARGARGLLRQATVAHRVADPAGPVVTLGDIDPLRYLVSTCDPDAALVVSDGVRRLLARDNTSPSCQEVLSHWQRLGKVSRVAEELHCHPNTVLNRFRSVEAITGLDPRRPGDLLTLLCGLGILRSVGTRLGP